MRAAENTPPFSAAPGLPGTERTMTDPILKRLTRQWHDPDVTEKDLKGRFPASALAWARQTLGPKARGSPGSLSFGAVRVKRKEKHGT